MHLSEGDLTAVTTQAISSPSTLDILRVRIPYPERSIQLGYCFHGMANQPGPQTVQPRAPGTRHGRTDVLDITVRTADSQRQRRGDNRRLRESDRHGG